MLMICETDQMELLFCVYIVTYFKSDSVKCL